MREDWPEGEACKYYGACAGRACRGLDGAPWRTPCKLPPPDRRPSGVHAEDRRTDRCPHEFVEGEDWRLLEVWSAWRQFGGMPSPGSVEEQSARLVEAFRILDRELSLVEGYYQAQAERRVRST